MKSRLRRSIQCFECHFFESIAFETKSLNSFSAFLSFQKSFTLILQALDMYNGSYPGKFRLGTTKTPKTKFNFGPITSVVILTNLFFRIFEFYSFRAAYYETATLAVRTQQHQSDCAVIFRFAHFSFGLGSRDVRICFSFKHF